MLADALRTDSHCYRRTDPLSPVVIELREWSRIAEELTRELTRLSNRVREQLWRYYHQILKVPENVAQLWFLKLWGWAPTPVRTRRVQRRTLEALLKPQMMRRITPDELLDLLRAPKIAVAPGTTEATVAHVRSTTERLGLVYWQLAEAGRDFSGLLKSLLSPEETTSKQPGGHGDAALLSEAVRPSSRRCSPRRRNCWPNAITRP